MDTFPASAYSMVVDRRPKCLQLDRLVVLIFQRLCVRIPNLLQGRAVIGVNLHMTRKVVQPSRSDWRIVGRARRSTGDTRLD